MYKKTIASILLVCFVVAQCNVTLPVHAAEDKERTIVVSGKVQAIVDETGALNAKKQIILVGAHKVSLSYYYNGTQLYSMGGVKTDDEGYFSIEIKNDKTYVEPDISVICDKNKLTDRGCNGAPDWVVEIVSPSSKRLDYSVKLFKYRSAGVREYWIVDPDKNRIMVYYFEPEGDSMEEDSMTDNVKVNVCEEFEIIFSAMDIQ